MLNKWFVILFINMNSNNLWIFYKKLKCFKWSIHVHRSFADKHAKTRTKTSFESNRSLLPEKWTGISGNGFFSGDFINLSKLRAFAGKSEPVFPAGAGKPPTDRPWTSTWLFFDHDHRCTLAETCWQQSINFEI